MPIENEGVSPRLPGEAHKNEIYQLDKLNSPSHLAQLERTRQMVIKVLKEYCGPEEISLEEVREMLDKKLPGVSLSDLVIEEREQSY